MDRVPDYPDDVTVYLVVNDFGKFGKAYVETDITEADHEAIIRNFISGQYSNAHAATRFPCPTIRGHTVPVPDNPFSHSWCRDHGGQGDTKGQCSPCPRRRGRREYPPAPPPSRQDFCTSRRGLSVRHPT
jgi:hypothetical protein